MSCSYSYRWRSRGWLREVCTKIRVKCSWWAAATGWQRVSSNLAIPLCACAARPTAVPVARGFGSSLGLTVNISQGRQVFPCRHLTQPRAFLPVDNGGSQTLHSRTETTPSPTNSAGSGHPEYIAYALVPVFFIMGLFGVLICHLLKKKGYRCTTEAEQDVEEEKVEKIGK